MSIIEGLGDRTFRQIQEELPLGARFVVYPYAVSFAVLTLRLSSGIQYVAPGAGRVRRGLLWATITGLCGWWGFPWGPIRSIQCLVSGLRGGEDVTLQVLSALARHDHATDTSRAATPLATRTLRRASIHSDANGSIDLVREPDGELRFEQRTSSPDGATSTTEITSVSTGDLPRLRAALHVGADDDLVPALRLHAPAIAQQGPLRWLAGHDLRTLAGVGGR